MSSLSPCRMCGGNGFLFIYDPAAEPGEDYREGRTCPGCRNAGVIENWRQVPGLKEPRPWVNGTRDRWNAGSTGELAPAGDG